MRALPAICLLLVLSLATTVSAQTRPEFKLGFKALADLIPAIVGQPLEDEHWGPNGDSLQRTTAGLMVWRKADNWTAFTNGHMTWINGPNGVQIRGNGERLEWERETAVSPQPSSPAPAQPSVLTPHAPPATPTPAPQPQISRQALEAAANLSGDLPSEYRLARASWEVYGYVTHFQPEGEYASLRGPNGVLSVVQQAANSYQARDLALGFAPRNGTAVGVSLPVASFAQGFSETTTLTSGGSFSSFSVVFAVRDVAGSVVAMGISSVAFMGQATALADRVARRLQGAPSGVGPVFSLLPPPSVPTATQPSAQPGGSSAIGTTSFASLDGRAIIVAADGKFLGKVTSNKHDADSIVNDYGEHGSKYAQYSIRNEYGQYGGKYSEMSPFNPYTGNPPKIIVDRQWAYLTVNRALSPRVDPNLLIGYLQSK